MLEWERSRPLLRLFVDFDFPDARILHLLIGRLTRLIRRSTATLRHLNVTLAVKGRPYVSADQVPFLDRSAFGFFCSFAKDKESARMPFVSQSQMATCFARRRRGWNCKEFLKETNICVLPRRTERGTNKRVNTKKRPNQPVPTLGPVMVGPRGGRYRLIGQGLCTKKLYVRS